MYFRSLVAKKFEKCPKCKYSALFRWVTLLSAISNSNEEVESDFQGDIIVRISLVKATVKAELK